MSGEEGLECEDHEDGIPLEHILESKYLGCVLDESGTNVQNVGGGWQLHEILLVPVLMYGSETMLWKGKGRSRIRAVQMDNLRGLLSIRKMDTVLN